MQTNQPYSLQELLARALQQPDELREHWLRDACADQPELLERVLAWHHATLTLTVDLAETITVPEVQQPVAEKPAAFQQVFGSYRITEKIGAGGVGAVYRAERMDGAFNRTVTIKIVNSPLLSDNLLARFRNEREILAGMQHPNIARLFDGGSENGAAYLVMEYVDGQAFHHAPQHSKEQTLKLFLKVCAAVQHAHNRLVLHRDIKPDNILIDEDGEPKLLDFGIAKIDQELADDQQEDLTRANPWQSDNTQATLEDILQDADTALTSSRPSPCTESA
jgi:serine/threonine protein kinase